MDKTIEILSRTIFPAGSCWINGRLDYDCGYLALSKLIGFAILLIGMIIKVPQIMVIYKLKSGAGLSILALLMEIYGQAVIIAYNIRFQNPISTYGETYFHFLQNIIISYLLFLYSKPQSYATYSLSLMALITATVFFTSMSTEQYGHPLILTFLLLSTLPAFLGGVLLQILFIWKEKSVGQLSSTTVMLSFVCGLGRLFTIVREVGDRIMIVSGLIGLVLNAILLIQTSVYPSGKQTNKALRQMEYKLISTRLYVHLPPKFSDSPIDGVNEYLDRLLMRYVSEVDGIVVAYTNIRLESPYGRIINDTPHVHFYIRVRFSVFKPDIGSNLVGIVNKVSPDHIGLLIDGTFNASIPSNQLRLDNEEYSWDEIEQCWKCKLSSSSKDVVSVNSGSVVKFTVKDLMKANDMLTISGTLLQDPLNTGVVCDESGPVRAPAKILNSLDEDVANEGLIKEEMEVEDVKEEAVLKKEESDGNEMNVDDLSSCGSDIVQEKEEKKEKKKRKVNEDDEVETKKSEKKKGKSSESDVSIKKEKMTENSIKKEKRTESNKKEKVKKEPKQ